MQENKEFSNLEYNSSREPLPFKEYGRNVQNLVKYVQEQEDPEKRLEYAKVLIHLMKQLNPTSGDSNDVNQRMWDHIYLISNNELDVDGPFPKPEKEAYGHNPKRVDYPKNNLKYRHYGKNVELLLTEAMALEDEKEKRDALIYIGKTMKAFYSAWNADSLEGEVVVKNIYEMTGRQVDLMEEYREHPTMFDSYFPKERNEHRQGKNYSNNRRRGKRRK